MPTEQVDGTRTAKAKADKLANLLCKADATPNTKIFGKWTPQAVWQTYGLDRRGTEKCIRNRLVITSDSSDQRSKSGRASQILLIVQSLGLLY